MNILNKIIVTDIADLFTVSSNKGRNQKIKNREYYGLSFCSEGKIILCTELSVDSRCRIP